MLKPSLCAYNDAGILVQVTTTITKRGADGASRQADEKDKGVRFKNHLLNAQVKFFDSQEIEIVIPIYNLTKCSDNFNWTRTQNHQMVECSFKN